MQIGCLPGSTRTSCVLDFVLSDSYHKAVRTLIFPLTPIASGINNKSTDIFNRSNFRVTYVIFYSKFVALLFSTH